MSVNLDKNRTQIISAWNDVVDDKSNTDWYITKKKKTIFICKICNYTNTNSLLQGFVWI